MNTSCNANADSTVILSFFIIGCILTIIGTILNLCSCLLFCRSKSLVNMPYSVFIIALSIADIVKLTAEYSVHILFFYIQHPYFVCSISWFLTMTSENTSYAFLCALGIERNLKVWSTDRRSLITKRDATIITIFIIIFTILFSCDNAYYNAYGYTFSLTNLLFIENIGLNNLILPIIIISTNIILIFGLQRRSQQRRHRLGTYKNDDWKERSVILYMLLSSIAFILLTSPIGILGAWSAIHSQRIPTNNLALILDLLEIIHHCSHFPILLMTSSVIRKKTFEIIFHPRTKRQNSILSRNSIRQRITSQSSSTRGSNRPQFRSPLKSISSNS
ncbi:unnamed protein product [Adineta steineri]|uniref:G-protein coupled receptors family 1 profile domain-containing protein n=1 Tax=Adineta steineri TaxID=433720 RepID=A0A814WPR6_9BILA|nr:unnamed protein product [Adineta steineri]CAF4142559.1 unnamed protein product [Adineta steineri]